jgi:hypothetical protein
MPQSRALAPSPHMIIVGVDTHKYVHVAVAIDRLGTLTCLAIFRPAEA